VLFSICTHPLNSSSPPQTTNQPPNHPTTQPTDPPHAPPTVSVLARISWDPRRLLEGLILGWFVIRQVMSEMQAQVAGGTMVGGLAVGHIAHLGGALAGVLLVMALRSVPEPTEGA